MGRKSSIEKLPSEIRSHIEKRLRENQLTLDELIADLQESFPRADAPSRSALGRYRQGFEELIGRQREIQAASSALVAELGENFDDRSGALLAQAVTTLATGAAHDALAAGDMPIEEILDLARAAKYAHEGRALSLKERQAVAREAREKLIEEQRAKLDAMDSQGGVTEDTKMAIREALGIV